MGEKKHSCAKDKNRATLFKFLADIDNEWPLRRRYSQDILGYKNENQIYRTLSPEDISNIENDALEAIKAQSARQRKDIYSSLHAEAKGGNVQAAKEFLDRTEGKVTEKHEHTGKDGGPIETKTHGMDIEALNKALGKGEK